MLARALDRLNGLATPARLGAVAAGYAAALAFALLAVAIRVSLSDAADRDASPGMHAFADGSLLLLAFGAASTVPTGLALHYLRPVGAFWTGLAAVALMVAATGIGSALAIADPRVAAALGAGSALAVPRILVAPVLAALFAFSGALSPSPASGRCLIGAAGMECATSIFGAVRWLLPLVTGGIA